jgi:hypothetical protein
VRLHRGHGFPFQPCRLRVARRNHRGPFISGLVPQAGRAPSDNAALFVHLLQHEFEIVRRLPQCHEISAYRNLYLGDVEDEAEQEGPRRHGPVRRRPFLLHDKGIGNLPRHIEARVSIRVEIGQRIEQTRNAGPGQSPLAYGHPAFRRRPVTRRFIQEDAAWGSRPAQCAAARAGAPSTRPRRGGRIFGRSGAAERPRFFKVKAWLRHVGSGRR